MLKKARGKEKNHFFFFLHIVLFLFFAKNLNRIMDDDKTTSERKRKLPVDTVEDSDDDGDASRWVAEEEEEDGIDSESYSFPGRLPIGKIRDRLLLRANDDDNDNNNGGVNIPADIETKYFASALRSAIDNAALAAPLPREYPPLRTRAQHVRALFGDDVKPRAVNKTAVMKTLVSPHDLTRIGFYPVEAERLFGRPTMSIIVDKKGCDADLAAELAGYRKERDSLYVKTYDVFVDAPLAAAAAAGGGGGGNVARRPESSVQVDLHVEKTGKGRLTTVTLKMGLSSAMRNAGVTPLNVVGARVFFESVEGARGGSGGDARRGVERRPGGRRERLVLNYLDNVAMPTLFQALSWCIPVGQAVYAVEGWWSRHFGGSFFGAEAHAAAAAAAEERAAARRPRATTSGAVDGEESQSQEISRDQEPFSADEDAALLECAKLRFAGGGGRRISPTEIWWLGHPLLRGRSVGSLRDRLVAMLSSAGGAGRTSEGNRKSLEELRAELKKNDKSKE